MDLIKFIKSLEELLYEVATWLLFYPRTLWLAATQPTRLARYTETELLAKPEEQFTDVVSPPMFLLLTLLLAHVLELVEHHPLAEHASALARKVFESDTNLLIFRSIAYCVFPVLMSRALLRHLGVAVNRDSLRQPFYAQCFFLGPFVILNAAAVGLTQAGGVLSISGRWLMLLSTIWYVAVQGRWFARRLGTSLIRGLSIAAFGFVVGVAIIVATTLLVFLPETIAALQ